MKVAAIQMDIVWERPDKNMTKAARLIAEAAAMGARLVALPEMFPTGFSMDAAETAEPPQGRVERFLSEQARHHSLYLLGTKVERRPGRPVNAALLFGPDGALSLRFAKVHPFSLAGEHRHYDAGAGLPVAPVDAFKAAAAICYDLRFPELFRAYAFRGAELFLVPANWPADRVAHWSHLLQSRAIENQAYVIGINRVGDGGGLHYNGCSSIIDPMGVCLAQALDREQVVAADIDREALVEVRRKLSFLQDARKDLFGCLWPER